MINNDMAVRMDKTKQKEEENDQTNDTEQVDTQRKQYEEFNARIE